MSAEAAMALFVCLSVAVIAVSVGALGAPILQRRTCKSTEGDTDATETTLTASTLRTRLAAIDQDAAAGLIPLDKIDEAQLEARRAALLADEARAADSHGDRVAARWRFGAIAFLGLVPIATAAIYLSIGAPQLIGLRLADLQSAVEPSALTEEIVNLPPEAQEAMIAQMVARLATRLEENPADADGWRRLARAYLVVGDPEKSATASRRLLAIVEGDADDWRTLAAALSAAEPAGVFPVSDEFLAVLDKLEARDPNDLSVLFYRAGAARETGDPLRAAALWREMLNKLPPDEPSRDVVEALIAEVEKP